MPRTIEPTVTARAMRPVVSGLRRLGCDPASLLAEAGLAELEQADPDERIGMSTAVELLERAAEALGDDVLGLHLAEHAEPGSFDVHFYAMASSATLGEAYLRMARYQRLIHQTSRVEIEPGNSTTKLRHSLPGGLPVPRHSAEFVVGSWVRAGRLITGTEWSPAEVLFAHPRTVGATEHERFFGAPVRFAAAENSLVLANELLELPCSGSDPSLLAVLDAYASDRLRQAPSTNSVAERARRRLEEHLPDGCPTLERLARDLAMSPRTLRRALAAEATSYRELLDQLRCELAQRHLAEGRLAMSEICYLLGFSELSSFYRAFKRWTGKTPRAAVSKPG